MNKVKLLIGDFFGGGETHAIEFKTELSVIAIREIYHINTERCKENNWLTPHNVLNGADEDGWLNKDTEDQVPYSDVIFHTLCEDEEYWKYIAVEDMAQLFADFINWSFDETKIEVSTQPNLPVINYFGGDELGRAFYDIGANYPYEQ